MVTLGGHSTEVKYGKQSSCLCGCFIDPKWSESCWVVSVSLWLHDYTVHGILQARIPEWVAIPFSRGSSQPRDQTQVSLIAGGFFSSWAPREAHSSEAKGRAKSAREYGGGDGRNEVQGPLDKPKLEGGLKMPHPARWRKQLLSGPQSPPLLREPLTSSSGLADHINHTENHVTQAWPAWVLFPCHTTEIHPGRGIWSHRLVRVLHGYEYGFRKDRILH